MAEVSPAIYYLYTGIGGIFIEVHLHVTHKNLEKKNE